MERKLKQTVHSWFSTITEKETLDDKEDEDIYANDDDYWLLTKIWILNMQNETSLKSDFPNKL